MRPTDSDGAHVRQDQRDRELVAARGGWPAEADHADLVAHAMPVQRPGEPSDGGPIVYPLPPEYSPTGLRTFDLGTVPASVTPPRSWRRAAWFAVGTSAAVMLGLTVAAVELGGRPLRGPMIDGLPAFPTGPMTLGELPAKDTTSRPTAPATRGDRPSPVNLVDESPTERTEQTVGSTTDPRSATTEHPPVPGGTATSAPAPSTGPPRTTIGAEPVIPTNPQAMGDRTEAYFRMVTADPVAAHALTAGGMAIDGPEGILARYTGVLRVEVRSITIDRDLAVTTSTVRVVMVDGSESIQERRLRFTWGSSPKIIDDAITA